MKRYVAGICLALIYCLFCGTISAQTITVSPVSGTIVACQGSASAAPFYQQFKITGSGLANSVRIDAPAGFEITPHLSSVFEPVYLLAPNNGSIDFTIYVRAAAGAPVGGISGPVIITYTGMADRSVMVNGTVDALPMVNPIADQTVPDGSATVAVNFTGTGQEYTWTNSDPSIGLPAKGRGNIPIFRAVNTTGAIQKATITVTPVPGMYAYVANSSSNSVSVVNTGTRKSDDAPVGTQPDKTIVSPDGGRVYVSNTGNDYLKIPSNISLLDAYSGKEIKRMDVPFTPVDIKLSANGKYLYIVSSGANKLTILNAADLSLVFATPDITQNPKKMVLSPDGGHLYIATEGPPGMLTIFNTSTYKTEGKLPNMGLPGDIAITPDGKYVYVSDVQGNKVNVIRTFDNSVIASPIVGSYPEFLAIHPDGSKVFVANTSSNNISVIGTTDNKLITTITADAFYGMVISPDGEFLYGIGLNPRQVSVISTANNKVVSNILLTGALGAPAISPDGSRLFVPELIGGKLSVINTLENKVVDELKVGAGAFIYNSSVSSGLGCSGTPISFTITVEPPPPPVISHTGTPAKLNITYGTASASTFFNVSATRLSSGVLVTPPDGFEVSTDNVTFLPTVTLGSTGVLASTRVYIRLTKQSNAASYNGNIVLSSGVTTETLAMPVSTVTPASITLLAGEFTKTYGSAVPTYNGPDRYSITEGGLKNGNSITAVTIAYGSGSGVKDGVTTYYGSVVISPTVTGGNGYLASNYTIKRIPGDIVVNPASLTITADNVDKIYGSDLKDGPGLTAFKATGLQNDETIGSVTAKYGAGAIANDAVKLYPGSIAPSDPVGGTFNIKNYSIKGLLPGNINVVPALLVISAEDKSRDYRTADPVFTYKYNGFVNKESELVLTTKPMLTTTATFSSVWGTYPIIPAGALAANYAITYKNGTLTIIPPITLPGAVLSVNNTFTPNGDGINDTWNIPALIPYPNCTVKIFDRRGTLLFNSIGYPNPWDGTYKGSYLPSGIYYYVIDPKQEAKVISGSITIIR